jgi:hypothetical protein
MNIKDLHNNIKISPAIDPAAVVASNGTKTSNTIDRQGFESLEFAIISGVLTDGTYTPTLYESDTVDGNGVMTSEAAVSAAGDMLGTADGATLVYTTDASAVKKIGYIGNKRYVRLKVVQSGYTSGGFVCAVAIQGGARNAPVA